MNLFANWTTVIWSMVAGVCLTLAIIHLFVWINSPKERPVESLFFSIAAVAASFIAIQELSLMHATTPAEYGQTLRWMHVSVAVLVFSLLWFVRFYFRAGRLWLLWLIVSLRLIVLVVNFAISPNATFQEIFELDRVVFLEETISIPKGEPAPWRLLLHISSVLFLFFVIDATLTNYRSEKSRRHLILGLTLFATIIMAAVFSGLVLAGVAPIPFIAILFGLLVCVMALGLISDLIKARAISEELQASQQRIKVAAQAARLGFWDWDITTDTVWTSPARTAQTNSQKLTATSFEDYLQSVHPDDRGELRRAVSAMLEKDTDLDAEFRLKEPNSNPLWIAARGQLERDMSGNPQVLRGVWLDISEQKAVERELQLHRGHLTHAERVLTMGQLNSAIVHELSQPLGAILRNAEAGELTLQQEEPDLNELQQILADIRQDDLRAATVIDRMRTLLKRNEIAFEPIEPNELIKQSLALLRSELKARNVQLEVSTQDTIPKILGDRTHLQQVVLNLALNSLDALEAKQQGARKIFAGVSLSESGMVETSIADNADGVDPDALPHLFELFFTSKEKGIGIGLAISKAIVEAHGGKIWAGHSPEGGAEFRFTIPTAEAQEMPE
jgi:signal transduction histidine kinase